MTNFSKELAAKMASRSGVVHIVEEDEYRLETKCHQTAISQGYSCYRWTQTDGLVPVSDDIKLDDTERQRLASIVDPVNGLLREVKDWNRGPSVVLTYDLLTLVNRLPTLPIAARLLKDITEQMKNRADEGLVQLVLCDAETPQLDVPLQRMQMELPDREEMGDDILDQILQQLPDGFEGAVEKARQSRDRILNSLAGLPAYQASNAISESIVRTGEVDPSVLMQYKKEMVSAKGLTYVDTTGFSFDSVGGLNPIKQWARKRQIGFDERKQREYGTRAPKGLLAGGKPGCSKSHFAKALAAEWGMVLLRFDMASIRGKYVGDTESQLQAALQVAEALSPCVLHIDEIDKQFEQTSGETDGGVGTRSLGTFLTWMQEKTAQVFVYGAGNRMNALPSEFMRAGRFDGSFWFDLPTENERESIVQVFADRYPKSGTLDHAAIVAASSKCSGAEIEACFEEAALTAMAENREMATEDIVSELAKVTKVDDTFQVDDNLARWRDAAQQANDPEAAVQATKASVVRRLGSLK